MRGVRQGQHLFSTFPSSNSPHMGSKREEHYSDKPFIFAFSER